MPASALDIARLRRMVNEPTTTTYSDDSLAAYLEAWPLVDKNGVAYDDNNANWIEAYDLHAAAADIWEEKAAALSPKHDFAADGANFSSNQMYENAIQQAGYHRASQNASAKRMPSRPRRSTYYPGYENPVFDEDEDAEWTDPII